MLNLRNSMKRATALLLSSLMTVSAFSIITSLNVGAVSYSEMSALDQYAYSGNDLGATYTKSSTTFKVWAPTATKVQVKFYATGSDSESGAAVLGTYDMTKQSQGVWSYTATGDYAGVYYTYIVTTSSGTHETVDIYARSTGVNGLRGMVVDLDSTDPDGWENDRRVSCDNQTDAVIWEAHVRDFSIASNSGISEQNKGKFLAFTETGTTVNNDGQHPTGIDYLEDLGITHIHLLPVFDYGSVDETRLNTDQFNWGYDPLNYNVPEGSYSTNPYDGNVRVNEFKQMVQSLHEKNIGVVMDVVYNHTYAGSTGKNDWFDYTVPGYYYRQTSTGALANGSGCGNETASDRAMFQKYMVDSVVYWATEYHIDGFRFDLMGLHDVDTMNKIRAALDEIDPDILVYGEPWNAGSTASSKATAVQSNMSLVSEEVSAFNDKVRDAIKGSCFNGASQGFIQGASGYETALKSGIQANSTSMAGTNQWSKQPSQTVTYTSAHDNFTLYDKLIKSVKGGSGYGNRYDDLVAMNKMAGGIILTSQGMAFFQAGEEFARTKYGDDNSYSSSTSVNQLDWNRTIEYADIVSYYKGLIEIRKAYSPFCDPTNTSNGTMYFSWGSSCPANVVAYTMYNKLNSSEWNFVAVIHNANSTSQTVTLQTYDGVTLPSQWVIVADGTNAGTVSLGTTGSTVTVPARSTMVLVDKTSFDSVVLTKKGSVTVNHVIQSTGETYKTETISGEIGTSYTTAPLTALTNNGYKVSTISGSTSGTYSETAQTVTYYYTLDTENYGTVVVKYVDASTLQEIATSDTYSGRIGTAYSYEPKSIKNYEVDLTQTDNASGTFAKGTTTVIFKYNYVEPSGLTIHYYNSNSWSTVYMYVYTESGSNVTIYAGAWPGTQMTNDGDGWYSGYIDEVESALFIANNAQGSQDPSVVNSTGYAVSGESWVKNGKVYPTGKVSVVYKDTQGNILATETLTGMADGSNSYTTTEKSFEGYALKTTPSNATGVYTEGTTTVTYVYESMTVALFNQITISNDIIFEGETVTFTNRASGGTMPYQFKIEAKLDTESVYTTIQDYTTNTTTKWTPAQAGKYDIQASVKDASGVVAKKYMSLTVADIALPLENISTLSATTITKGNSITLTGKARNGASPYQYAMVAKHSTASSYTVLKNYDTTDTKIWTPSKTGTYSVIIKVKDCTDLVVSKSFTVTVKASTTALTNNSTISATSIAKGQSVTMTGKASGGTSPYQYAMVVKHSTADSWTTLKGYNTTATKTWTPAKTGTYTVQIKVKD
ncbi:MAG: type I pullulanase, partial [Acutalibacteraceae bacterium]